MYIAGNHRDDLEILRDLAPDLVDGLLYAADGTERDLRRALGTFIDIPQVGGPTYFFVGRRLSLNHRIMPAETRKFHVFMRC